MKSNTYLIIEGTVVSAKYGATKFDSDNKYRLALESDSIPYDDITAYESVGSKMTPSWFKDKTGYINLNSIYNIPVADIDDNKIDFDNWIESGTATGSKVKVKVKQKEGAIYPIAIRVIEEGEKVDLFSDF